MFLRNSKLVYFFKTGSAKVKKCLTVSSKSDAEYKALVAELVALGLGGFNLSEWFQKRFDELNVQLRDEIEKYKTELEQQSNVIEGDFTEVENSND